MVQQGSRLIFQWLNWCYQLYQLVAPAFDLVAPSFFSFATCHGINQGMLMMNSGFNGPKLTKAFWVAA